MAETAAGAKVTELFGVDISGIDPATRAALTRAVLAREAKPPVETGRRVIITWPAASGTAPVLPNWGVTVHDADSGEQITAGFKLSLVLGTDTGYEGAPIEADITALVGEDGELLPAGKQPILTEEYARHRDAAIGLTGDARLLDEHNAAFQGRQLRTKVFRYLVAEMRVTEAR